MENKSNIMKDFRNITKHVNEVVLYSLNWYAHSGDIVRDLQRYCIKDAKNNRKFIDVSSPEKLLDVMRKNYDLFVEKVRDAGLKPYFLKDKEPREVRWEEDPIKAELWWYIIRYSSVQSNTKWLTPPSYDKYNRPQFAGKSQILDDFVFKSNSTDEELNRTAAHYFNMTNVEILDYLANQVLNKFNFSRLSGIFGELGENITAQELEDEYWEAYENFVDSRIQPDNMIPEKYETIETKHLLIDIGSCFSLDGTMNISVYGKIFEDKETSAAENYFSAQEENIGKITERFDYDKFSELAKKVNHPNEEYLTPLPEYFEDITKFKEYFSKFDIFHGISFNPEEENRIRTGGFEYHTFKENNNWILRTLMLACDGFASGDKQLYNQQGLFLTSRMY